MDGEIDESFKRAGAIPFKWEIRPGIPKPVNRSEDTSPKLSKLRLPPSRIPPFSDSSNVLSQSRSPSPSPSKRHGKNHAHRSPKVRTTSESVSQGCFAIPSRRHKDDNKVGSGDGSFAWSSNSPTLSSLSSFQRMLIAAEVELAATGIF